MAVHEEGPKRAGRFIKKGSSVLRKVALSDFSFEDLREASVITFDNPDRSIIHTRYHHPAVIDAIANPLRFEEDLLPDALRRPIIRPVDFTKEWEDERRRSKQRKSKEEEEFDYQHMAEMAAREAMAQGDEQKEAGLPINSAEEADSIAAGVEDAFAALDFDAAPETPQDNTRPPVRDYDNVDLVSDAISTLAKAGDNGGGANLTADDPTAIAAGRNDFIPQQARPGEEAPPTPEADDSQQAFDPEAAPAAAYQRQIQTQVAEQVEKQASEILAEAKARGYEAGFAQGEEKAAHVVRQQSSEMFGKVTELIHEFENLKMQILDSVQDNFYELAQAVAESLLRREFNLRPESLVDVIHRAVTEGMGPDKVRIKVHPDTHARLSALGVASLDSQIIADTTVEPGDFKLESDMSVVDGNVRKLVKDLLDQADLDLFEKDDKGSKAG